MMSRSHLRVLIASSIPLLVIGLCAEAVYGQEQFCMRVSDEIFSPDTDGNGGWFCKRVEDVDAAPRWNMTMRDFKLDVKYFYEIPFQDEVPPVPSDYGYGKECFRDQRTGEEGVMTGGIHVHKKKGKSAEVLHFERGYDIDGTLEILYVTQLVDEFNMSGSFPPELDTVTEIYFGGWKVETEGKGKLRHASCVGSGQLDTLLEISACDERPLDTQGRPCPCILSGPVNPSSDVLCQ